MSGEVSFPKSSIHVVLLEGVSPTARELLARHGYTKVTELSKALVQDKLLEQVRSAHVLGIRSRTQLTAEVLQAAPKLFAVGCFCIGTNQVDLSAAARLGITVFNAPHSNTRSVAELVLAEMVMLVRKIGDKNTAAHKGEWLKSAEGSFELRGKTVGIVGYGHIGSQVSILAEAFGMRVLYHDIVQKLPMGNARQVDSLEALLGQCDFLTLHVPAARDTVSLLDAARLARMRQGAYVLNLSRGNVVDIDALADALKRGHLAGAAIDVFPVEPTGNDEAFVSPLQGLGNVILTPHIGGSTQEAQENIGREVAQKLVSYSDTGATLGSVNMPELSLAANPNAHRLLHIHHNQPGVLREINRILAELQANILGQHLQTTAEVGYVVTDVDRQHPPDLIDRLREVPGTIRARILY